MTCGCTVFGNLFEAAEAVKTVESEEAAEAVTTVESEEGDSEFGGASRCASEFSDGFCLREATTGLGFWPNLLRNQACLRN